MRVAFVILKHYFKRLKRIFQHIKHWLQGLSFRTGVIVLLLCVVCYVISFAQMALPISVTAKGVLWTVFFGLAKTFQYSALLILGKEGWLKIRSMWRRTDNE